MPVFDFSGASDKKPGVQSECTYTTFQSNEQETSPEKPIMVCLLLLSYPYSV